MIWLTSSNHKIQVYLTSARSTNAPSIQRQPRRLNFSLFPVTISRCPVTVAPCREEDVGRLSSLRTLAISLRSFGRDMALLLSPTQQLQLCNAQIATRRSKDKLQQAHKGPTDDQHIVLRLNPLISKQENLRQDVVDSILFVVGPHRTSPSIGV
ncbi:hypothetical protein P692DRAFT_20751598 [Suillus brevipes Sb2]|nr:hypothetical protein P692DRAFT_20751598 [Suillus brevipes Sb2]